MIQKRKSLIRISYFLQKIRIITGEVLILFLCACTNQVDRPNILWITCEDANPNLGCYGDPYARTPNIDQLAAKGIRYINAFSHAGVCAPARSGLITGMYPTSIGSHHMRCLTTLPDFIKCFPEYLRDAGYYCTNNVKKDYNFIDSPNTWDESSRKAHWRNRKPDQLFFSVFNFTETHESKYRAEEKEFLELTKQLTPEQRHEPDKAIIPPYMPDTRLIRKEWARYNDLWTAVDYRVGELLYQLQEDGLSENTIVFFFSDQGVGLPRAKQWITDAGMHVPLIVYLPEKYKHLAPGLPGSTIDRLISFVDFGPSVLSLAGIKIPEYVQGKPFLGKQEEQPRQYVYGIRDRMDERYDMVRAVRDNNYKYYRNYMPHLPHWPWLTYMEMLETSKEWRRLKAEGKLKKEHSFFMGQTKPIEELYDIQNDPYELNNLADLPQYSDVVERMREIHLKWVRNTVDLGLLPEHDMRMRAKNSSEYEMARSGSYPLEHILETTLLIGKGKSALPKLMELLNDDEVAVRYWAAIGLTNLGSEATMAANTLITKLNDPSPEVRIAVAEALCSMNHERDALPVLAKLIEHEDLWVRILADNVVDRIGEQARPILDQMHNAIEKEYPDVKRNNLFVWLLEHAIRNLEN